MNNGSKRKRVLEGSRITYHAGNLSFARLFVEESLDDMKNVVRQKLGLADDADVQLVQLIGDTSIVLEDDADFDAFFALAHNKTESLVIRITSQATNGKHVSFDSQDPEDSSPAPKSRLPPPKKRKLNNVKTVDESTKRPEESAIGVASLSAALNSIATGNIDTVTSKRRRESDIPQAEQEPLSNSGKAKRKKAKKKRIDDGTAADIETDSAAAKPVEAPSTSNTHQANSPDTHSARQSNNSQAEPVLPHQRRKSLSLNAEKVSEGAAKATPIDVDVAIDAEVAPLTSEPPNSMASRSSTEAVSKQNTSVVKDSAVTAATKDKASKKADSPDVSSATQPNTVSARKKVKDVVSPPETSSANQKPPTRSKKAPKEPQRQTSPERLQRILDDMKAQRDVVQHQEAESGPSLVPSSTVAADPEPPAPSKVTKPKKDTAAKPKTDKKVKAKKVNGTSIAPPPPPVKDSFVQSDVAPVAGSSTRSQPRPAIKKVAETSSDTESDVPVTKNKKTVKCTPKTADELELEEIVRGPRKSRQSLARVLSRAAVVEGAPGDEDEMEALEVEPVEKPRISNNSKQSRDLSSESEDEQEMSRESTPVPKLPWLSVPPKFSAQSPSMETQTRPTNSSPSPIILAPDSSDEIENVHSPIERDDIEPSDERPQTPPRKSLISRMKGKSPAQSQNKMNGRLCQSPKITRNGPTSQLPLSPGFVQLAKETQSQTSVSPDWTTLPKSPSLPDPESMFMEDELTHSSSPHFESLKARLAEQTQKPMRDECEEDLFLENQTQTQFPFIAPPSRTSTPKLPSASSSDDDDDEDEVAAAIVTQSQKPSIYTRLSEISQLKTFMKPEKPKVNTPRRQTRSMDVKSLYGNIGSQRDSDSDSESSESDREKEKPSHIPNDRRAGARATKA